MGEKLFANSQNPQQKLSDRMQQAALTGFQRRGACKSPGRDAFWTSLVGLKEGAGNSHSPEREWA
jgi:hypothetical protein